MLLLTIYRILNIVMKIKQLTITLFATILLSTLLFGGTAYAADCGEFNTMVLGFCGIEELLAFIKNILTVLVGIAAVGGIIYGSILYISSGGSSEGTKKGLTIIKDTVIGIIVYAFMYVILGFVMPGGV